MEYLVKLAGVLVAANASLRLHTSQLFSADNLLRLSVVLAFLIQQTV